MKHNRPRLAGAVDQTGTAAPMRMVPGAVSARGCSRLAVIGFQELTRRANELTLTEFRPLEIYTFLVLEYLVLILLVSWGVRVMERRMGTGVHGRD
jgi:ABC-type arginine transport system permease subunit